MKRTDLLPVLDDDSVDLIALLKNAWIGRRIILTTFLVFVVLGLLVALFSPVKYSSSSVLLPQIDEQKDLGQLGGLASLAGLNLSSMLGNTSGISPDLYPNVVGSYPFLNELVNYEFVFEDEQEAITLYEKIKKNRTENKWIKYTIRLPWTLKARLFPVEEKLPVADPATQNLVVISREKASILEQAHSLISVEVMTKTGLITVNVEHEDAYASAQIAQKVVDLLQAYIIDYKTSQVRNSLDFVEARYEEKRIAFEHAQKIYFDYQDAHRNRVIERADSKFQALADDYELSRTIYQNLAQQVEQTRLSVKKETPAFTVIEPVKVPVEKSAPRRSIILLGFSFLGLVMGLGVFYGFIIFMDVQASWKGE